MSQTSLAISESKYNEKIVKIKENFM